MGGSGISGQIEAADVLKETLGTLLAEDVASGDQPFPRGFFFLAASPERLSDCIRLVAFMTKNHDAKVTTVTADYPRLPTREEAKKLRDKEHQKFIEKLNDYRQCGRYEHLQANFGTRRGIADVADAIKKYSVPTEIICDHCWLQQGYFQAKYGKNWLTEQLPILFKSLCVTKVILPSDKSGFCKKMLTDSSTAAATFQISPISEENAEKENSLVASDLSIVTVLEDVDRDYVKQKDKYLDFNFPFFSATPTIGCSSSSSSSSSSPLLRLSSSSSSSLSSSTVVSGRNADTIRRSLRTEQTIKSTALTLSQRRVYTTI